MTERKKTGADKLEQNTKVEVAQTDVVEANTQPITCGLIMPIAANEVGSVEHWLHVRKIITDALIGTDFKVKMVSDSNEVNVIQNNIVTNIYSNDIVICDVSSRNPNVMFELGMRLTFDKPVVIIKDKDTPYSFDVGNIQHLEYPRSLNYVEIQHFQQALKEKTLSTLAASKAQGYSPFLSHYKIQHVSKVETEVVGRDDYLMSAINEIKSMIERKESNRGGVWSDIENFDTAAVIKSLQRKSYARDETLNKIASNTMAKVSPGVSGTGRDRTLLMKFEQADRL
ncbi:hypothetical protein RY972_13465 [Aeromonas allosaccharophila]|uniref:RNA helicase n=1 Tax=Aeromonas allosaccharophila TaxID=656 RepID=A0ABZ0F6D7_9GAMM|nr:hypothetical protein [Aeromonas allosaccharophila]WOE65077.1 hypothetical protein RY972_13465 [Aeromonas allosaccharophila]